MGDAVISGSSAASGATRLRMLPAARLAQVLRRQDPARDAEPGGRRETPEQLLQRLVDHGELADATRFLAHALPGREAVWWGCMCVAGTCGDGAPAAERAAIEAAEAWVWQPREPGRAEAAIAASQLCGGLPGGWPGLAIAWNRSLGGTDTGFGRGVEGAVLRAARRGLPASELGRPGAASDLEAARLRRFITSGIAVSRGAAGRIAAERDGPGPSAVGAAGGGTR